MESLRCFLFLTFSIIFVLVNAKEYSTTFTTRCADNVVSKWNKKNVGENLREWMKSITISESSSAGLDGIRKSVVLVSNEVHAKYLPEVLSPHVVIIGKLNQENDVNGQNHQQFVGPIWADMNSQREWHMNETNGEVLGISKDALFHNGLYYGTLTNSHKKIGNFFYILLSVSLVVKLTSLKSYDVMSKIS